MIPDRGPSPRIGTPCVEFMFKKFLCPESNEACLLRIIFKIRKKAGIGHLPGSFKPFSPFGHRMGTNIFLFQRGMGCGRGELASNIE